MNRGLLIGLAVVAVLLIGIGGCLAGNYNKLVTAKEMNGATTFTVPVAYEAAYRKLWGVG